MLISYSPASHIKYLTTAQQTWTIIIITVDQWFWEVINTKSSKKEKEKKEKIRSLSSVLIILFLEHQYKVQPDWILTCLSSCVRSFMFHSVSPTRSSLAPLSLWRPRSLTPAARDARSPHSTLYSALHRDLQPCSRWSAVLQRLFPICFSTPACVYSSDPEAHHKKVKLLHHPVAYNKGNTNQYTQLGSNVSM